METTWSLIKSLYTRNLDMPAILVDLIAVHDILECCCQGFSNLSIAFRFNFDEDYVQSVIKEFFGFDGFETDIQVDTRSLYQRHKYNRYVYVTMLRNYEPFVPEETCNKLYLINWELDKIEKGIDDYYARH